MTQPTSAAIMQARHWTLFVLRVLAVLMLMYGSVLIIRSLASAFAMSRGGGAFFFQLIGVFHSNGYNPFWNGCSFAVLGIAVALASRRVSRWVVPAAHPECPACGYTLQQLTGSRCPECGYQIRSHGDSAASG